MLPLTARRVFLSGFAALTMGFAVPALAADAGAVVNEVSNQVIDLIKNKTGAERTAGFTQVLETKFDLPFMGQSALGKYWASTNEEQRARFLKATATAEAKAYAERFGQYGGQTVVVGKVSKRGNAEWVESTITQSNGPPIRVEWELQDRGSGLRVTDVKVEGVSMVMTRRSDFSSYISRNGNDVEALIKELEARGK